MWRSLVALPMSPRPTAFKDVLDTHKEVDEAPEGVTARLLERLVDEEGRENHIDSVPDKPP